MTTDKHEPEPTQRTRPKKGKPIEIPVPKREDFEKVLKRAAKVPPRKEPGRSE